MANIEKITKEFQELQKKYQELTIQKKVIQNKLEEHEKTITKARKKANELFGVSEPEKIRQKLEEMEQKANEILQKIKNKIEQAEKELQLIDQSLSKIDNGLIYNDREINNTFNFEPDF